MDDWACGSFDGRGKAHRTLTGALTVGIYPIALPEMEALAADPDAKATLMKRIAAHAAANPPMRDDKYGDAIVAALLSGQHFVIYCGECLAPISIVEQASTGPGVGGR